LNATTDQPWVPFWVFVADGKGETNGDKKNSLRSEGGTKRLKKPGTATKRTPRLSRKRPNLPGEEKQNHPTERWRKSPRRGAGGIEGGLAVLCMGGTTGRRRQQRPLSKEKNRVKGNEPPAKTRLHRKKTGEMGSLEPCKRARGVGSTKHQARKSHEEGT